MKIYERCLLVSPPPSILIFSLNYIVHMQFQLRYWISILIACFVDSRINIERQEKFKVFYLTMRVMTVLLLLLFFFYLSHSFTSLPSFLTFLLYAYLNCGSILCIFCQCNTENGFFSFFISAKLFPSFATHLTKLRSHHFE